MMKKSNKSIGKLTLERETIRSLRESDLARAAGGNSLAINGCIDLYSYNYGSCTPVCMIKGTAACGPKRN